MKKHNHLFKKLMVQVLVGALIQVQTFNVVFAQTTTENMQNVLGIINNSASQILNAKSGLINAQVAQAQMAALQKQLAPQVAPSKYFPECQLPKSMNNFPQNACQVSTNPNQLSQMFAYEAMSTQMTNYYDQMLNEATMNSTTGIKCLTDKTKMLDSQLTEMINNITRLQTQLKQESETFREGNKALLANLENTNSELFGTQDNGSGANSVNSKTRDFSKLVSPSCQNVIGKEVMANANQKGFNGLLTSTEAKNKSANDFNQSRGQIETEIRNEVQSLKNSIASNGVDNWANPNDQSYIKNALSNGTSYPSLISSVQKDVASLNSQKQRIANEMSKIYPNYSLPPMNQNASADLQSFINGSQDYFKKQYINNCTTDSSYGVAIDIQKVVDSVQQKSTNNSVAAIQAYKQALQNILNNSSLLISDKLNQIKALETTYPGMSVTYSSGNGSTTIDSPYNLLANTVASCTAKFSEDQTFAKAGTQGVSEQTKATRATALLQEYKNLGDSFANNLGNDIINTVINCSGESAKATDSCDESTVDAKANGFCMSKAATCASTITNCYTEINTQIDKRKADMAKMAVQYNANVQTMVTRANALYSSQQANITSLLQNLQARFPGTNFEIPNDMYIKLPELSKDKYGVDMAGNGDINSFIADLPSKMDKLKEMFGGQRTAVDNEINTYISTQKASMTKEKERWAKLGSDCKVAADSSTQQINELNKSGAQAAKDMKLFCRKYDYLKSSPMPACDTAKSLATDVAKANNSASEAAINLIVDYNAACLAANNEGTSTSGRYTCTMTCSDFERNKDQKECERFKLDTANCPTGTTTSGSKKSSNKPIDLANLCNGINGTDPSNSNSNLVNKILDQQIFKKTSKKLTEEQKKSLQKLLNNESDTDTSEIFKDDSNSPLATFFNNLTKSNIMKNGNICKNVKDLTKANEVLTKAKEDLKKAEDQSTEVTAAKTTFNDLNLTMDDLKISTTPASDDSTLTPAQEKNALLAERINTIKKQQLGEQSISTCDSNNNLAMNKSPFSVDVPNGFDQSITGSNGASR